MIRNILFCVTIFNFFLIHSANGESSFSLIADARTITPYCHPVVSPNGKLIAYTVQKKFENEYYDPKDHFNPLFIHPVFKGTKIYVGGVHLDQPIEISAAGKSCSSPSWSPDGKSLAYLSDAGGFTELWLYDMEAQNSRKVASVPISFTFGVNLVWSLESDEIYARRIRDQIFSSYETFLSNSVTSYQTNDADLAMLAYPDDLEESQELIAINVKNGTTRSFEGSNGISSLSQSPTGRWLSYTTRRWVKGPSKTHGSIFDLQVITADGKSFYSLSQKIPLDHRYDDVTFAWHPLRDHLYFVVNQQLWVAQFEDQGLILCEQICPELGNVDPSTLSFNQDGKTLIVGLDAFEARDYSRLHAKSLCLISLDKHESRQFPLSNEWVFSELLQNHERIAWQPTRMTVAYKAINQQNGANAVIYLNIQSGSSNLLWEKQAKMSLIDFNQDQSQVFCFYEDFNTPEDIYACDFLLKQWKRISHAEPHFDQLPVGNVHLIETLVPGCNGQTEKVQTAIILPSGASQGDRLPAIVVHYPGANSAKNILSFGGGDSIGGIPQWLLTNERFAVILPNLVLGEEAIGKPLQAMTERLLPQVYQAAELGYIDLNRVGIMGQSYGAYGTAGIISHTPLFRAAVATNGVYDLASFSHYLSLDGRNFWMAWAEVDQGRMGKSLFEDKQCYIENSPFYRADKIETPLLLIHGEFDDAFEDAKKMFSALRRLNRPVNLVVYHKGWHILNYMTRKDHLDAAERILQFFHLHLSNANSEK